MSVRLCVGVGVCVCVCVCEREREIKPPSLLPPEYGHWSSWPFTSSVAMETAVNASSPCVSSVVQSEGEGGGGCSGDGGGGEVGAVVF